MAQKTLAQSVADGLAGNDDQLELQAHAALVQGNCVAFDPATGITAAPAANDRLLALAVAEEAVASGERGKFKVSGRVQALSGAAIASGELLDVSADLKCDPLAVQTDGNGSLKALDAAAGADELVWCKFL